MQEYSQTSTGGGGAAAAAFAVERANAGHVKDIIERAVQAGAAPGVSAAVVKHGRAVYLGGAGWADGPRRLPATQDTVYHWWSMTKVVTAVSVLKLVDRDLLDLDAPVQSCLPFFKLQGGREQAVTIRRLLQHTSGLPDSVPAMIGWVHFEDEGVDQTAQVRKHLPAYNRLKFDPGTRASYSNFGYMVLGAVIEQVSGMAYEDYVRTHILSPLAMSDTDFLYPRMPSDRAAAGSHPILSPYTPLLPFLVDLKKLVSVRSGGRLWFNRFYLDVTPPSGLIGSVAGAAGFVAALLAGNFLKKESHARLLPSDGTPGGRPLGWAEYGLGERPWVQHRGGGPGFASIMRLYPREGLGVILMSNNTHFPAEKIVHAISALDWNRRKES